MTSRNEHSHHNTLRFAGFSSILAALLGLGLGTEACTPATPEDVAIGGSATGGSATGGSGGMIASGGSVASGGTGGTTDPGLGGTGPSGGTVSTGGASGAAAGASSGTGAGAGSDSGGATGGGAGAAAGGSGGMAGGAGGTDASGGAAGGPAVLGCDWSNPAGRTVLFDGTSLAEWRNLRSGGAAQWRLIGDGTMEVVPLEPPTDIQTVKTFENLCVHVEYMTPTYPSSVMGQSRGNSGVFLKRAYEMQILDSIGRPPAVDSCGAVYSIAAPLVVACNMELVWNTYEIEFKSSVWDASGRKTANAVFVAATLNGRLVQQNVSLNPAGGFTQAGQPDAPGPQPLMLQDHRNLVRFRNIWVKVPRY